MKRIALKLLSTIESMKSHPIFVSTKEIFGVKIPKKTTFRDFGSLFTLHYSNNFCYSIFKKKLRIFFLSFSFFYQMSLKTTYLMIET